jgi:molybdate transport system ATP-binding protein
MNTSIGLKVNIIKQFRNGGKPSFALRANFSISGQLAVLFGPSGSGKTVTLQCLAGLIQPDSGLITLDNKTLYDSKMGVNLPPRKRQLGYVFQDYTLFPHLTVRENIAFGLKGLRKSEITEKVEKMIKLMRLEDLGDCFPKQISGGQKQRVALARALIINPSILLLDEPFSALDSAVREKLRQDILEIKGRFSIPIVFVTHDLEEAYQLADYIVIYNNGQVLQVGDRQQVFYHPDNRTVARFIGAKNIFSGIVEKIEADKATVRTKNFSVCLPASSNLKVGKTVEFCIRPEDVMVVRPGRDLNRKLAGNVFSGKIVNRHQLGSTCLVDFQVGQASGSRLQSDFDFIIKLPTHAYQKLDLDKRQHIKISLKEPAIHIFKEGANQ